MKKFKNYGCYIIPFLIPWLLIVVHSIVRGSWLTGQGSLLNGDTGLQLYPLLVELWNKVHSGESLFFSWNAGNGIDFYLNMIYYLISPLNIIILLVPKSCILNAAQFVMVLKWSLMGVSVTYYFLHTRYNKLQECKVLFSSVLGVAFSLSSAVLILFGYFNWGDVVILFPFVLLALERLMDDGKWKMYYILLSVSMVCNFYMAYQVCIFLVIWFLIHCNRNVDKFAKKIVSFIGSSLLAAVTSAMIILPAVMGAANRYHGRKLSVWINNLYNIGEKIFLFNEGLVDWQSFKPNIYFSIGFFICVILFFTTKMKLYKKAKISLAWLFMMVSLFSGALTVFWHGFSTPNGVYHRYLYLLIFLMLYMVMETITNLQSISKWKLLVTFILELGYMIICFLHISELNSAYGYLITFLLIVLYNLLLFFFLKGSIKYQNIIVCISVLVLLELGANAFYELKEYNIKKWDDFTLNHEAAVLSKKITLKDGERVSMAEASANMGLVLDVPSTNQFTSYSFDKMVDLYNKLGLEFNDSFGVLSGSSPLTNLLFNIKYGISIDEIDFSDSTIVEQSGTSCLYKINRLAGMGYMTNDSIADWDVDNLQNFDLQNDFVKKATNSQDIFETIEPDAEFTNGTLVYKEKDEGLKDNYFLYDYISITESDTEYTVFSFTVDENMDLYMDVFSQLPMNNLIYVDGELIHQDQAVQYQGYYHIGQVKKGQKIYIYSTHSMGVGEEAVLWFRFAKFNEENYAKAYEKLSKNVYNIDNMDSTYVSGTIHADEDGIMMTSVPAMKGFTVLVDGKAVSTKTIGNAFIGVPLSKGDHKVEFKYMTPYFKQGALISLFGVAVFVVLCIYDNRRKKKEA